MTDNCIAVTPEIGMHELRGVLRENRISGVPVVKNDKLVGIISIEDFLNWLADDGSCGRADGVCISGVVSTAGGGFLAAAAAIMAAMPVGSDGSAAASSWAAIAASSGSGGVGCEGSGVSRMGASGSAAGVGAGGGSERIRGTRMRPFQKPVALLVVLSTSMRSS